MISDTSPLHMARDLVARHSDIGFIRGYIINWFGRDVPLPTREQIAALRADYVAHRGSTNDRVVQSEEKRAARERIRQANAPKRDRSRRAFA